MASNSRVKPLKVREEAPDFACDAVIQGRFEERSLSYYTSRKQWLMIFFIPMAFSFVCPTEVLAFDNVLEEFTELNCSVVFVSTDSKYSLHSWQARPKDEGGLGEIDVPLLSDQNHRMSRAYGVLCEDGGYAFRGRFIVNPDGIVKHISINDVAVGRSVLESLRLLQAYKAEYEHGVFCAANWRPGDATLEPTQEAAQQHITKHFGDVTAPDETIPIAPPAIRTKSSTGKPGESGDKPSRMRSHSHHQPESSPTTPRIFNMETLSKVFGGPFHHEPQTPLADVEEMDALNSSNERHAHGHKKNVNQGTTQSYFDFEPFSPSPKIEKKNPLNQTKSPEERA